MGYAKKFFVESVNYFSKKPDQNWKMYYQHFNKIFGKVNTKHFSKASDFWIMNDFQAFTDLYLGLIDQFTGKKRSCLTFSRR